MASQRREAVRALAEASGVALDANRQYDWESIDVILGISLPEDYKIMAESFPGGWFRLFAELIPPDSASNLLGPVSRGIMELLSEIRSSDNFAGSGFPFPVFPEPGGLLPCGLLRSPGYIFWKFDSSDPGKWPLVLTNEEFDYWELFDGSLSDFLLEVAAGRFDASRFPDDFRWEGQSHIDIRSRPAFEWDTACGSWPPGE